MLENNNTMASKTILDNMAAPTARMKEFNILTGGIKYKFFSELFFIDWILLLFDKAIYLICGAIYLVSHISKIV